jgi:hypothetical protein
MALSEGKMVFTGVLAALVILAAVNAIGSADRAGAFLVDVLIIYWHGIYETVDLLTYPLFEMVDELWTWTSNT